MCRSFSFVCLLLCGLPLFAATETSSGIELRLNAPTYYPGDLIELSAERRGPDYAEFTIRFPPHPKLHFVAYTPESVRYQAGEYVQRAVWYFQPVTAGEIVLKPIQASLRTGSAHTEELTLPPIVIRVESYGQVALSDELAALPDYPAVQPARHNLLALALVVGMAVMIAAAVVWLLRSRQHRDEALSDDTKISLSDLTEKLQQGQPVIHLMEQLLARPELELSAELREAMQAAVYAGRSDTDALLKLIKSGGVS